MLCVGEIVNTHGVKGELKVIPLVDNPDDLYDYKYFFIDEKKYEAESIRFHKNFALIKLNGIDDINVAERIKGKFLELPREDLKPLPEGMYYICDLIGIEVFDETIGKLGTINEVFNTGSNDVYVVDYMDKPLCIPVIDGVIKDVDLDNKKMTVILPKGLL
jgi:16S rRNA processing protein RimM